MAKTSAATANSQSAMERSVEPGERVAVSEDTTAGILQCSRENLKTACGGNTAALRPGLDSLHRCRYGARFTPPTLLLHILS